jgi:hypothetical protein
MGDDEATGYIGGAVTPEMEEAFGKAVDWVGETASDAVGWAGETASNAVDWAKQEVTDVAQTVGQGIDTLEKFVEENPESLLE